MFELRSSLSNCNTGNYKGTHIPMVKLESTEKGFQYASIKAWNNILINIRELSSLNLFKSHLKKHFMSNENYCMPPQRTTPFKISVFIFYFYCR